MSMFCFQCEEATKGTGCTTKGICGKTESVAVLHDLLVHVLKGLAVVAEEAERQGTVDESVGPFIAQVLALTLIPSQIPELLREALPQLSRIDDAGGRVRAGG